MYRLRECHSVWSRRVSSRRASPRDVSWLRDGHSVTVAVQTGDDLPERTGGEEREEQEEEEEEEEEDHELLCRFCKDSGEMLLCDFCPAVYHMQCLNPPLGAVPEGDWKCPACVVSHPRSLPLPLAPINPLTPQPPSPPPPPPDCVFNK